MSCHVRLWFVPGRTACRQSEVVDRGAVTARAVACQHVAALRVAALSDFHANVPALEAAFAEVERERRPDRDRGRSGAGSAAGRDIERKLGDRGRVSCAATAIVG
jgi:hypothetical protein